MPKSIQSFCDHEAGFILSTGCEFPPNGNSLSAVAMVNSIELYGVFYDQLSITYKKKQQAI